MKPFAVLFPERAAQDLLTVQVKERPGLPDGQYLFQELYCVEPGCDCQHVLVHDDYLYATPSLARRLKELRVVNDEVTWALSDHCPVVAIFDL